jgi:RNA processing factor Prp31
MKSGDGSVVVELKGQEISVQQGELTVTIKKILDYIDASDVINTEAKRDIKEWFFSKYDDLSKAIDNVGEFIETIINGLSSKLDPEALQALVDLLNQFLM